MSIPFTEDAVVRARFAELGQHFVYFRDELKRQSPAVDIEIDSAKLYLAVTSYFIDVARYKWYHFPKDPAAALLDETKKAAFLTYWLNKLSPVSARRPSGAPPLLDANGLPTDPSVMANIFFTLSVAMTYLDFILTDELVAKLLYHMLWRDETAKSYMLLFEMLTAAGKGDIFVKP